MSASGHGLDAHAIQTILYQTLNVGILFGALGYFGIPKIRAVLKQKRQDFLDQASKSEAARSQAQAELDEIKKKLQVLETQRAESILRAKADAAATRESLLKEGQALAERLRSEARQAAAQEVERARRNLQEEALAEALKLAKGQISSKVSSEDHQRLQGDFIQNIQVVQQ